MCGRVVAIVWWGEINTIVSSCNHSGMDVMQLEKKEEF